MTTPRPNSAQVTLKGSHQPSCAQLEGLVGATLACLSLPLRDKRQILFW